MGWVWIGVGAAITIAALITVVLIIAFIEGRAAARHAAIRNRQHVAETAMVQTVQNTVAEMFDTVRRHR